MAETELIDTIRNQLAAQFYIESEGNLIRIGMPIMYDDGDGATVYLNKDNPSDMFLTDLGEAGSRDYSDGKKFAKIAAMYPWLTNTKGELSCKVKDSDIGESAIFLASVMADIVSAVNHE